MRMRNIRKIGFVEGREEGKNKEIKEGGQEEEIRRKREIEEEEEEKQYEIYLYRD